MGHAQTNDQGTLVLSGTISKTTCVLSFSDAQSTLGGRKTLSFGSITPANIPLEQFAGATIPKPKLTVILSVQNADGAHCDGIGSGKWDVGISITDLTRVVTTSGGSKLLLSDGDRLALPRRFTDEIGVRHLPRPTMKRAASPHQNKCWCDKQEKKLASRKLHLPSASTRP
jgi:hypothetical protein